MDRIPSDTLIEYTVGDALRELNEQLRERFPIQLQGVYHAVSEFGIKYETIANGWPKGDGEDTKPSKLPDAVKRTVEYLDKATRAPGLHVLVWRCEPRVEPHGVFGGVGGVNALRLYMRCHVMPASMLKAAIERHERDETDDDTDEALMAQHRAAVDGRPMRSGNITTRTFEGPVEPETNR